jgi:hypothetical protein
VEPVLSEVTKRKPKAVNVRLDDELAAAIERRAQQLQSSLRKELRAALLGEDEAVPRARALTGLDQKDFARAAGVNPDTLNRLKGSGAQAIKAKPATVDKLLTCLAQHNIALAPGRIIHAG